jgi:hypothetical protein
MVLEGEMNMLDKDSMVLVTILKGYFVGETEVLQSKVREQHARA